MLKIHSFLQRALKPVKAVIPVAGKNMSGITAAVLFATAAIFLILSPDAIYNQTSLQEAPVYTSGNTETYENKIAEETAIEAIVRWNPENSQGKITQVALTAPYIPFKLSNGTVTATNDWIVTADEMFITEAKSIFENSLTLKKIQAEKQTAMSLTASELKTDSETKAVQATADSKVDSSSTKEKSKITVQEKVSKEVATKKTASNEVKKTVKKVAKNTVKKTVNKVKLSSEDIEVLQRIVEAEATGENVKGKILVANVILNRVKNKDFPDSVKAVVFQKDGSTYQFSPIKDGRYYSVRVSKSTKDAIKRVLEGEDYSNGALYFSARIRADKSSMSWFDRHLKFLFKYGGHEFFK
ncbi:cell wall hydrolase [Anaerocolumna chitinilytica]|uniref:Cell wall hydrolase SleB domain-containing protein n=1 Tax=Anaerocolumna chitinilytica TaxID=1727145 RepID=A0A7I8DQY2_9FIRM|nr:cell wall hydrolase [Anaerocolumna chitinilytica]BCK00834.1 hypothetical protein bsdcttw_38740 [Anaerocolumna chitinilytica]